MVSLWVLPRVWSSRLAAGPGQGMTDKKVKGRGESTRVGWKVHRLSMMQWSFLTKMWFIFNIIVAPSVNTLSSIGVAVLGFQWYRSSQASHHDPRKVINCRYYLIIGPIPLPSQLLIFFLCWGTENIQMVPNQNMEALEDDQPVQIHSHAQQPLQTTDLYTGALSWSCWWNRTPFVSFPCRLRNVSSTTFQSPELLIQCGFIWKETIQLVSGKVKFNACQVSLLWHNSFLVSLWTFQLT